MKLKNLFKRSAKQNQRRQKAPPAFIRGALLSFVASLRWR
ncbi:hypothetical protein JCM19237_2553 [Photobacterium aphoticum]|uniref:Uncharacterized protein n=1 Tax=Photobacterium aphoticum TaxID=754436 RepID=A0A090RFZ0_9GAMM|nr:hypothetical protein JCM19237_2553 [Photobacterium aphoticum]